MGHTAPCNAQQCNVHFFSEVCTECCHYDVHCTLLPPQITTSLNNEEEKTFSCWGALKCIAVFGIALRYIEGRQVICAMYILLGIFAVEAKSAGNPTFPFAPGLARICRVGGTLLCSSISWCTPCRWRIPTGMPATPQSCALLSPLPNSRLRFCPRAALAGWARWTKCS